MIIPVVKLGTLAIRTLAKPISARLKKGAGLHPKFRDFIISIAQANHRVSIQMQRRIYGRSTDIRIRPLNEERAVEVAADLLGEFFVFTVAGVALIYEVQRGARSEARKEEMHRQEMEAIKKKNEELTKEMAHLKLKMEAMKQIAMNRSFFDMFRFWHARAYEDAQKPNKSK
ncbi:hypothetical protein RJ640_004406, partial [Escallonia rubra]